ncbi:(2Fe-2S)-binding protein [Streptomyces sp. V4-01]|uniref:Bacterioferritin-associated ferredoxin n=1 Tax=Actinacidiphila polyblastidii TaxID=3110430 RepID=A0ABU7P724_9ACTN|nr:(2Fe-2S)-binding protein [Streptomyces sp. V4-01]
MYVCSCFGITEQQVKQHSDSGRCTPRQIASACKAGTDCGSCVKRIQALLGRGDNRSTATRLERAGAEAVPSGAPAVIAPAALPEAPAVPALPQVPALPALPGVRAA